MRFISPSTLVFALLMFPLPWIEVRCEMHPAPPPFGSYPVLSQSGLQAVWGGISEDHLLTERRNITRHPGRPRHSPPRPTLEDFTADEVDIDPAPLMGVYVFLLLAGITLGFAMPRSKVRIIALSICCLGASAVLLTQAALRFPIEHQLKEANVQARLHELAADNFGPNPTVSFHTGYAAAFYLAVLATLGSMVGVILEVVRPPKVRPSRWADEDEEDAWDEPSPRRRRRRRRHEDEDDDDEEDRPPRRRRDGYSR